MAYQASNHMTVTETKKVDIIAVPEWEPDYVVLVLTDHLEWGDQAQQGEHLLLLQAKINAYIAFIESGEIFKRFPPSLGKKPLIRLIGLYALSQQAEMFIERVTEALQNTNICFEFTLKADERIRNM